MVKLKRNIKSCRPANSTFGKPCPQADASFAKRAISADPHVSANLKDGKKMKKHH